MNTKPLTIELSEQALENLTAYCEQTGLDQTTVIQSYLLTLGRSKPQSVNEHSTEFAPQQVSSHAINHLQATVQDLEREKTDLELVLETTLEHSDYITAQLRTAKVAAEAASQAKSMFLSRMSHELRTPLNAILGFSQLLENTQSLNSQQRQQLTMINRSGEHLLILINDILDMSKLEAGEVTLDTSVVDLQTLLYDLKLRFFPKAEVKGLHLNFNCSPELPRYIETDAVKLKQALGHLLENAIKFTEHGQVCLTVSADIGEEHQVYSEVKTVYLLYCEVTDSGLGIAEADIESIFVPFEQTQVGCNLHQGTGLGLSISQRFIQLMGGHITVNSQVGVGSRFEFYIPVYQCSYLSAELSTDYTIEHLNSQQEQHSKNREDPPKETAVLSSAELLDKLLADMPVQWINELHHAASQLKGKRVMQLIEQVPIEKGALAQHLRELAENYQFEQITEVSAR
ncbi:MAG: ATP-binding protein [Cyanobacteria bacterium P01_B01_bin.77]